MKYEKKKRAGTAAVLSEQGQERCLSFSHGSSGRFLSTAMAHFESMVLKRLELFLLLAHGSWNKQDLQPDHGWVPPSLTS